VTFEVGTEMFTCTGKTLVDPGYTTIMHWQAFGKNETVPTFTEGEMANIQDVSYSFEFSESYVDCNNVFYPIVPYKMFCVPIK
jgi:DNA topoisomerase IA